MVPELPVSPLPWSSQRSLDHCGRTEDSYIEGGTSLRGGVYFKVKSFMSSVKMFYFKNDTVWKQSWLLEKAEAVSWFCERSSIRECTNIHSKNCKQNSPRTGTRGSTVCREAKLSLRALLSRLKGCCKSASSPQGLCRSCFSFGGVSFANFMSLPVV